MKAFILIVIRYTIWTSSPFSHDVETVATDTITVTNLTQAVEVGIKLPKTVSIDTVYYSDKAPKKLFRK